ncbi:hypothetical protein MGI18_24255 [Bacillus sp. OVS6]|nr:hypothetical protein MGI18_24255 [Bacillus sp. OVS6]
MIIFSSLVIAGCQSFQNEDQEDKEVSGQSERQDTESILKEMDVPWSITKSDDVFYLSERTGQIVKWNQVSDEKVTQKVKLKKKLHLEGEGGFLGFELSLILERASKPLPTIHIKMETK